MKDDFMADPLGAESGTYLYENSTPLLECFDEIMTGLRQIQDRDQKLKIGFSCGVLNIFPFGKLEEYQRKYGHIQIQWEKPPTRRSCAGYGMGAWISDLWWGR